MRANLTISHSTNGQYATDLLTDHAVSVIEKHDKKRPLFMYLSHLAPHSANRFDLNQAPAEDIARFMYIKDMFRRKFAAMMWRLDIGVGRIIAALTETQMLNNSVVIFFSDNGAPNIGENKNGGSNLPLRGVNYFIFTSTV